MKPHDLDRAALEAEERELQRLGASQQPACAPVDCREDARRIERAIDLYRRRQAVGVIVGFCAVLIVGGGSLWLLWRALA